MTGAFGFSPSLANVVLGLCVVAFAGSLVLRSRVPRRASDQSPDLFWTRASTPALLSWMPVDLASLAAVLVYADTGSPAAFAVWVVGALFLFMLKPGYFERR